MSEGIQFSLNNASEAEIVGHLWHCDANFVPPLSDRVEINDYANKITNKAMRFEAWSGDKLVGLVGAYCNDQQRSVAFITSVSVLKEWMGKGIAESLIQQCIAHARVSGMRQISLEVASDNLPAIGLYEKSGFVAGKTYASFVAMDLYLE
ncbi:MAG: GNAT family N-acetyltransferase [Betaproteobacteria bacterium]|nr:GNAT family N-acetyltransferase [Betaproteobacteria bacterium]